MTILQSLPILSKVLILIILGATVIPFILVLAFSVLLTLVFVIPAMILFFRWFSVLATNSQADIGVGGMRVSIFYAIDPDEFEIGSIVARLLCLPVVGVVFGGIHCVGWFFDFPSSAEAILWRVSSVVLTGIAFLFPILFTFVAILFGDSIYSTNQRRYLAITVFTIILLVYVVSRLLLLVEAFISLRHLTLGMLALVKWTSFIPHI